MSLYDLVRPIDAGRCCSDGSLCITRPYTGLDSSRYCEFFRMLTQYND